MSDLMILGVLRMPVTPQSDELTLRQYIDRGRQAADLIDQQQARIAELESYNVRLAAESHEKSLKIDEIAATVEQLRDALKHLHHNAKASGAEMGLALDVAEESLEATPRQNLNAVKREVAIASYMKGYIDASQVHEFGCDGASTEKELMEESLPHAELYVNTKYPSGKE